MKPKRAKRKTTKGSLQDEISRLRNIERDYYQMRCWLSGVMAGRMEHFSQSEQEEFRAMLSLSVSQAVR